MRRWKPQPTGRLWVALVALAVAVAGALYLGAPSRAAIARPPAEWAIDGALFLRGLACLALLA
ncbi:MAG TPA: hypothetical protein PKD53_32970, partial [Chloroflexaceae bacterium]|nr:hypothetical protein [Chloroflexaceae bacterium]